MIFFPDDTQRLTILGKTGSGKTFAGVWHLSKRSFDRMPWVIINSKGDSLLNDLGATRIDFKKAAPKQPGLYMIDPLPGEEKELDEFLWRIWDNENTGIYIDEGYMVGINGKSAALNALLTQGRSKHIPMIILSQRPVWLSRFVFSESDFFQSFWLHDFRDRQTTQSFLPFDVHKRLDAYHSYYYDVGRDSPAIVTPVPGRKELIKSFRDRINPRKSIL